MAVATVYDFFVYCEIPCGDGLVEKADFVRSATDDNLLILYALFVVWGLFEKANHLDFLSFCVNLCALRLLVSSAMTADIA